MKTTNFTPPRMEKLKTAAELFGLSYYAVRQLVLSGTVPAVRLGGSGSRGKLLINCDALSEYLNKATLQSTENLPTAVHGIRIQH